MQLICDSLMNSAVKTEYFHVFQKTSRSKQQAKTEVHAVVFSNKHVKMFTFCNYVGLRVELCPTLKMQNVLCRR